MIFIDTNYFLRYLLHDISEQDKVVKKLFLEGAEGKEGLVTSTIVLFEIHWVLRSFYSLEKKDCLTALQNVLKLTFIQLAEREMFIDVLKLFARTNLDIEDCYNIYFAKSKKVKSFKTFDKKLEKEFLKLS